MSTGGDRVRTTPPGGVAEGLAELVPALLDRVKDMTDRMVGILVQTEPAYREVMAAGDPQLRASLRRNPDAAIPAPLPAPPPPPHAPPGRPGPAAREVRAAGAPQRRASLRRNLEAGIRGLLPDVPATDHASHAEGARAVGRQRAAQGVPLEAVLRAYRLGGQVTWEALVAQSRQGDRHDGGLLLEGAGSLRRANDRGCSAAAEGYRAEERRRVGLDSAEHQRLAQGPPARRGDAPARL